MKFYCPVCASDELLKEPKIADVFEHEPDCKLYHALNCPVAIECEHGYDVCLICDPCNCFSGMVLIVEERDDDSVKIAGCGGGPVKNYLIFHPVVKYGRGT
jgi:hypothetical protein